MENEVDLKKILQGYIKCYPNESESLLTFEKFIDNTTGNDLYNRKNFTGHITASAVIVDVKNSSILVIYHKILDKWLQPGGHVEMNDDSILKAALREIEEETNLPETALHFISAAINNKQIPLDIDSHIIPANEIKNEAEHYHHDFKYLFKYTGDTKINVDQPDAFPFEWRSFDQLADDPIFSRLIEKARKLLTPESK